MRPGVMAFRRKRAASKIQSAYRKYKAKTKAKRRVNVPIGPYLGPVPKLTGAKMPKMGVNLLHFEDFGTTSDGSFKPQHAEALDQGSCSWFGFTDTGGAAVYLSAAAAITRSILVKAGHESPSAWNEVVDPYDDIGVIMIFYRHTDYKAGADTGGIASIDITNTLTLEQLTYKVAEVIFDCARDSQVIWKVRINNPNGDSIYTSDHIADSILDIRIKNRLKFQNITPADTDPGGGMDMNRNAINANPLDGFIYRFADPIPKFADGIRDSLTDNERKLESGLSSFTSNGNGKLFTRALYDTTSTGDALRKYRAPVQNIKTLFSNSTHQCKVHLQPGGYRDLVMVFNFHGTVTRFMENIAFTQDTASTAEQFRRCPKLGSSYLVSLEPSLRTSDAEAVRVAWNREIDAKSSFKFFRKPQLPPRNVVVDYQTSFATEFD